MEDFDKIYLVKIYLNKELIYIEHFTEVEAAKKSANFWEDKDYICEVIILEKSSLLERGEWRDAKPD